MKLLKPLLITTFLSLYLTLCPIKAQEHKPKQVTVNKKKYSLLEDKVINEHNIIIKDKETLLKVLKTNQIQEEINSSQLNPKAIKFLELYAKGQELTIKYNEHIDWLLRLPPKILANITIGQKTKLEDLAIEIKDLTISKLKETAKDIANDPEKQLKHLSYEYFSRANKKVKFNLSILKTKPEIDYETAVKFEDNSYFINTFMKPSQKLYHNIENLRKLEERWVQTFLQEVSKILPENTEKITEFLFGKYEEVIKKRLEELQPFKQFQESTSKNKEKYEEIKSNKQKDIENKVEELIKNINFDNNTIVYISNQTGNFEIYSMKEDGKNKIQLTHYGFRNLFPKWTPKGKIVFSSEVNDKKGDIYRINKTGKFIQQLNVTKESEGNPIILSNGNLIFISNKNGNDDIYLKEQLGETKKLTNTAEDEGDIDISYNEKWLCFVRDKRNGCDKEKEGIFILNLETGLERKLDDGGYNPRFSPEGKITWIDGLWIKIKDIYGNLEKTGFPDEEECKSIIGYPKYFEKLTYLPKVPNTKPHLLYLLGWIDKDTILYRADIIPLPEKNVPAIKNIYSFNLKTSELKKLTNNNNHKVWIDHADCLRK